MRKNGTEMEKMEQKWKKMETFAHHPPYPPDIADGDQISPDLDPEAS